MSHYKKFAIFAVMVGFFVAFLIVFKSPIYHILDAWSLVPHKEELTEFYIEKYESLPSKISSNQTVHYSFAIHNLEGKDINYAYMIHTSTLGSSRKKLTDYGTVFVRNGETKIVSGSYTFGTTFKQVEVAIELLGREQTLHFTIPRRQ